MRGDRWHWLGHIAAPVLLTTLVHADTLRLYRKWNLVVYSPQRWAWFVCCERSVCGTLITIVVFDAQGLAFTCFRGRNSLVFRNLYAFVLQRHRGHDRSHVVVAKLAFLAEQSSNAISVNGRFIAQSQLDLGIEGRVVCRASVTGSRYTTSTVEAL